MSEIVTKVEGKDTAQTPEESLPTVEDVVTAEVVAEIAKGVSPGSTVESYSAKLGTKLGDNFMSIMYSVKMKLNQLNKEQTELDVMLKTMPKNNMRVQMINDCHAFVKESKMYSDVFPTFLQFQKDQGLQDDEIFKPYPLCYAFFVNGTTDYIALQDLRSDSYKMACRHSGFGIEETKLVVQHIAKFHAISFAKYHGDYEKLMTDFPYLTERMFRAPSETPEVQQQWIKETFMREAKMVREKNAGDEAEAQAIEGIFTDNYWEKMHQLLGTPVKYAIICHGDCWTNNFLFQYDHDTNIPRRLKFIDFQMSRIGSRVVDLGYFLYTSLQLHVLNNHEEDILKVYYDEFKAFATRLGYFDPALTFEQLLQEYSDFRLFAISMGCMLAPITSAQSGDIPDLETIAVDTDELFTDEAKEAWFGGMNKENGIHDKILNIAKFHIPKLENNNK